MPPSLLPLLHPIEPRKPFSIPAIRGLLDLYSLIPNASLGIPGCDPDSSIGNIQKVSAPPPSALPRGQPQSQYTASSVPSQ